MNEIRQSVAALSSAVSDSNELLSSTVAVLRLLQEQNDRRERVAANTQVQLQEIAERLASIEARLPSPTGLEAPYDPIPLPFDRVFEGIDPTDWLVEAVRLEGTNSDNQLRVFRRLESGLAILPSARMACAQRLKPDEEGVNGQLCGVIVGGAAALFGSIPSFGSLFVACTLGSEVPFGISLHSTSINGGRSSDVLDDLDRVCLSKTGDVVFYLGGRSVTVDLQDGTPVLSTRYNILDTASLLDSDQCALVGSEIDQTPDQELPFIRSYFNAFWVRDDDGFPALCRKINGEWVIVLSPTSPIDKRLILRVVQQ